MISEANAISIYGCASGNPAHFLRCKKLLTHTRDLEASARAVNKVQGVNNKLSQMVSEVSRSRQLDKPSRASATRFAG